MVTSSLAIASSSLPAPQIQTQRHGLARDGAEEVQAREREAHRHRQCLLNGRRRSKPSRDGKAGQEI